MLNSSVLTIVEFLFSTRIDNDCLQ